MLIPASPDVAALVALADTDTIQGLLLNRAPGLLSDPRMVGLMAGTIRGTASQIVKVMGPPPWTAFTEDQAAWCLALGVAATLEAALFPEQQLGDGGRAKDLRLQFLQVLGQLADGDGIRTTGPMFGGMEATSQIDTLFPLVGFQNIPYVAVPPPGSYPGSF